MESKLYTLLEDIIANHKAGEDNDSNIVELEQAVKKMGRTLVSTTGKAQRIYEYIQTHKKPVTSALLAKHFCLARSTITTYLRDLHDQNFITKKRQGQQTYWSLVAVFTEAHKAEHSSAFKPTPEQVKAFPTSSFRTTSYPHIRGYDD